MTSPLLNDWANHMHAEGRANRTVRERMILLAKLERDLGTPALAATREQLRDWLASPEIGQSTRSVYHSNINAFYLWAVDQELRDDNPLAKIKPARRPKRKPRPIAVADYERARDAAGLEMRAMLMLITLAGLRDAEIARFQSRHIDISGEIIEVTGKGGNTEIVDAHPDLLFIARRMPRGYWFPSSHPGHRHIGGRTVWERMRLHLLSCGVFGTPHQLRHTFGTELVRGGADLRVVQGLMRHANLETTAGYTEITDGRKRTAIRTLPSSVDVDVM
ncbi:tyrosine-type recombinase/integrase [Williamsia herbipolensis]|uniref:Tyrosine-type recombinase/integrase n=1 Tax=Williamsia herbipolensis TaxID=1603258 RepID=A0AAU4K0B9_9NOCA|nr:tyrosine-type recombinase/integrase [Williamsia herbipolensis]